MLQEIENPDGTVTIIRDDAYLVEYKVSPVAELDEQYVVRVLLRFAVQPTVAGTNITISLMDFSPFNAGDFFINETATLPDKFEAPFLEIDRTFYIPKSEISDKDSQISLSVFMNKRTMIQAPLYFKEFANG